jgi:hypothetical protein
MQIIQEKVSQDFLANLKLICRLRINYKHISIVFRLISYSLGRCGSLRGQKSVLNSRNPNAKTQFTVFAKSYQLFLHSAGADQLNYCFM